MSNESIKILLVDDEPDILEILSYNLDGRGLHGCNRCKWIGGREIKPKKTNLT